MHSLHAHFGKKKSNTGGIKAASNRSYTTLQKKPLRHNGLITLDVISETLYMPTQNKNALKNGEIK
jgi:hypothetical protein